MTVGGRYGKRGSGVFKCQKRFQLRYKRTGKPWFEESNNTADGAGRQKRRSGESHWTL
jgi:hypothetical protein